MKYIKLFLTSVLLCAPAIAFGDCSDTNLKRCLDSACAIGLTTNPNARCQYCGFASSFDNAASTKTSTNLGSASKYTISNKDLKKAPTDPGERYVWARQKCFEMLDECTANDADRVYYPLILEACQNRNKKAEQKVLMSKSNNTKSDDGCYVAVNECITDDKHCLSDYRNCESDTDFTKYFSDCSIKPNVKQVCTPEYLSKQRSVLIGVRDQTFKTAADNIKRVVKQHQDARKNPKRSDDPRVICKDDTGKQTCINSMCGNLPNQCAEGFEYEIQMAEQLCKYYDTACSKLK